MPKTSLRAGSSKQRVLRPSVFIILINNDMIVNAVPSQKTARRCYSVKFGTSPGRITNFVGVPPRNYYNLLLTRVPDDAPHPHCNGRQVACAFCSALRNRVMLLTEQPYLIAESIPHLVWVAGPNGATQYVNQRWQQYTGLAFGQAMGWDWQSAICPDDLPQTLDLWHNALRTGAPYAAEFRLRRADGEYRWHIDRALPLRDADGHITHWFGTCTDIENQKRAEATVQASEGRFRALIEKSFDAVILIAADGTIAYASPSTARVLGFSLEELVGRDAFDLVHPDDRPKTAGLFAQLAAAPGGSITNRHRALCKDGSWRWLDVRGTNLLTDPNVRAVVINYQDITERRAAEEDRARDALLLANVQDSIIVTDLDGIVTYWNEGATRLFGWTAQEMLGRLLTDRVPEEARAKMADATWAIRDGTDLTGEWEDYRKDGSRVWIDARVSRITDPAGTPVGLLGISRDVSDRKRAEAERGRLEEQFRQSQKMEGIGRLAGGIAHDFNNLLTVINGYAAMLLEDLHEAAPESALARDILKAGERAAALTQQLLTFSRKQIVAPRVLDLNAVVADAEVMLRRIIGEDIVLTKDLQPGLGRVRADPTQVQQVVMNLVVNARDAMPRGGRLSITTRDALRGEAEAHILLAVTDTGCGMTDAVKAHLFEPFFTTKRPGAGTGLGLPTVYGIVKQSSGHIEVESEPGVGTTFRIYLPRTEEAPKEEGKNGVGAVVQGSETVLLAEDEDGVRALIRKVLQAGGYAVLEASDGAQALWLAGKHRGRIDLLITDVVMPGLDGRGLAERLVAVRPGLRVLYLSGYTDDAVVRHGVLKEQVEFLQKPFSPVTLAQKVREVLDQPAPDAAHRPDSA
jgi:two-component system, cell cycle sensor histidine kinase and response regulator CckA